jgi:mono/diheme cytochrome c family protein
MQSRIATSASTAQIARRAWPVLLALVVACTVPGAAATAAPAPSPGQVEVDADSVIQAWRTVRQMDCARCHGRDHDGLAAPSILEFVRNLSRERFERMVLDGDPGRGMPGYGKTPRVADNIDAVYCYFVLRADGSIGRGEPYSTPTIPQQPVASPSHMPCH